MTPDATSRLVPDAISRRVPDAFERIVPGGIPQLVPDGAEREQLAALAVALLAGVAVFAIATRVFPYHSANHDEAVYLQQAAMLLDGRLQLFAGDLAGAVRPWFFVRDGGRLYPRYAPVPAAAYAVSMALFGQPRVTLAVVAAANVTLVYALAATAFDRRVGVVAAAIFAAAPMALVTSATFLPYAPTTLLNLAFAAAYLRGVREDDLASAAAAGVAIGLASFARPYTATLFAAPFVAHALWSVGRSLRDAGLDHLRPGGGPLPEPVRRTAVTAAGGLAFVLATLAYNAHLTGSPFLFPFEAFAPHDGLGFGRRRILDHAVEYTPALALRANGYALWYLATRWFTAGALGTGAAIAGLALAARRWRRRPGGRTPGVLLAGLFVSVPAGNLLFWGNYNVLATPGDPTDGLVSLFGPFYHFDLLAPLSIFAAVAAVAGWRRLRATVDRRADDAPRSVARGLLVAALLAGVLVAGAADAAVVSTPLERNAAHAERYEAAYAPFEDRAFERALVFVPTPYGDWLAHPFQALRNDPGLDGPVVYALDRGPAGDFAVLDGYPDRTYYRFTYRGEWTADPDRRVVPRLEPLSVREGDRLAGETVVGVPANVDRATVRLETREGGYARYGIADPGDRIVVRWTLAAGEARLSAVDGEAGAGEAWLAAVDGEHGAGEARAGEAGADEARGGEAGTVRVGATDEVVLLVRLVGHDGSTLTYRQAATVRTTGDGVEVVWPPERTVCPLVDRCGARGTYLPDRPGEHRDGVVFRTRLRERDPPRARGTDD